MATTRRIIEGTWKCSSCDTTGVRGRLKRCPFCGSPREAVEKFDFGEADAETGKRKAETVDDAELLKLATVGHDWFCANCDTANKADVGACGGCGASAEFAALSAPLPPEPEPEPVPEPPPAKSGAGGAIGCTMLGGIAVFALICCGAFWFVFLSTTTSSGKVEAMRWERAVELERFTPESKSGWRSDMPRGPSVMPVNGAGEKAGASNVRACVDKEKKAAGCETKTRSVQCGTTQKCKTKDLGNGFAEEVCEDVPKMCDEKYEDCWPAVREDWCTWDTHAWKRVDRKEGKGEGKQLAWPAGLSAGAHDRLVRHETYTLSVAYDSGGKPAKADHNVKTEADYLRFDVGMPVAVDVNRMGSVTDVRPLEAR